MIRKGLGLGLRVGPGNAAKGSDPDPHWQKNGIIHSTLNCAKILNPESLYKSPPLILLVGYHGEPKVNLFHNRRII